MIRRSILPYIILSALALFIWPAESCAQKGRHTFTFGEEQFLLDGKPFQVISGEMHPARIPEEYWRHRIRMAKAMGCNTVSAYIFWNYHEQSEGIYDFHTGNRNISEFIKTAADEGMWVIIRPGPYVCAEWEFGGLPPYLLRYPEIKIRCLDPVYMKAAGRYISRLADVLREPGGDPIAVHGSPSSGIDQ